MAKSYNSYVGNGSTQVFSLSFPYLAQSHVKVYVGGVEDTTFTWLTSSSLTLSSVPASGDVVLIKRVTPTTPLIDFVDGSVVTESLLDTATIQSMYIAEETQDTAATAIIYNAVTDVWEGNAKRLSNLADPVDAQDAVTKDWAETGMSSQLTQATAQATTATAQATIATTQATNAAASASTATTKASEASTSATNSANSATASASSATASAASASTATTKASEASGSATSAAGSASTATTKATEATNSATAAAASATSASNSASTATTKATEATTGAATATSKASEASSSATSAASSATNAATSATNASASATTATTKATEAAASASSAATNAATVASNVSAAATSATNAAASAADAATSATSAAASASSAAALLDNFDDRYLGAKSSAPTVDNDGNALLLGALYFDSTTGKMRVYTASGWLDASSASVATLAKYEYVATAGQTTFTGADANGVTLSYTVGAIVVSLNGALLRSNEYTATSGSSVVLASGANASDELVVYAFGNFLVADTYTRAQADALLANKLSNANNSVLPAKLANSGYELGMRNRIINGAMMIDQRNAGASGTSQGYTLDRWNIEFGTSGKLSWQQNAGSVTPPVGFTNYLGVTSSSAYSITASDYFNLRQAVEGVNVADLGWGTANAQTVTLSFWVRSSLTGTWSIVLRNSAGNRSYPATYTISSANTWEYKTITIAGDTTGTWLTNNGVGVWLIVGLANGSNNTTTAGAWAAGQFSGANGANSLVGTNGATFYITGVQLEKGSTATPFEYRPYGQELALCQRYFEMSFNQGTAPANNIQSNGRQPGVTYTTNTIGYATPFAVVKRAAPSMTFYSSSATGGTTNWGRYSGSWLQGSAMAPTTYTTSFEVDITVTATTGTSYIVCGHWTASAEL